MTDTSVYLIGKENLLREGIKSLLMKSEFHVTGEYDSAADIPKEAATAKHLIINIDEERGDISERIRALKSIYSRSWVVVVSSQTEMPAIMPVFSAGVDGYILKDISSEGFIGSLKLITAGKKVCPTFMLTALSNHTAIPAANDSEKKRFANGPQLSKQELRIIQFLASGEPNKIIAHNLNITEATVKVHVKTILRKTGAKNRTQAALWATTQGIVDESRQLRMRM